MALLANLDRALDYEEFLEWQGPKLRRESARDVARWAVDEAQRLVRSAVVYEWLPVRNSSDDRSIQIGVEIFDIGHHARLIAPAREACVAAFTIGPLLEERSSQLMTAGEAFKGYMLEEAGMLGLLAVGRSLRRAIEEEAARRQWGVGAELAVGDTAGWRLEDLGRVCSLVDLAAAGIGVSDGGMLVPRKSGVVVVGIGPGYTTSRVRSCCDFCSRSASCEYRESA